MAPGYYVVRMPHRGMGSRLSVESVCFRIRPEIEAESPGWCLRQADSWRDFVQSQHPKDDVFVIEKKVPECD